MKIKTWIVWVCLLTMMVGISRAQTVQVPEGTLAAFSRSQPGIQASWSKNADGSVEAEFKKENTEQIYVYDASGALLYKKMRTPLTQLPQQSRGILSSSGIQPSQPSAYKVISRTQEKFYEAWVLKPTGRECFRFALDGTQISRKDYSNPTGGNLTSPPTPEPKIQPQASQGVAMRGNQKEVDAGLDDEDGDSALDDDQEEADEEESYEDIDSLLGDEEEDLLMEEEDGEEEETEDVEEIENPDAHQ